MKAFLICFVCLILSTIGRTQDAPNFTVTATDGMVHRLYEDHLDQGQTVVLKLFFVECPPCNSIAPLFEELYQDWGAGQADVEFIELSVKNWASNTNAGVANYQSSHNLNFIGVGHDGGSIDATAPYRFGNFGPYTGTPTFVVIAPDRSVQYNPFGSGNEARIEAINQAIINTGAVGNGNDVMRTSYRFDFINYDSTSATVDSVFLQNEDGSNRVLIGHTNGDYAIDFPNDDLYPNITIPFLYIKKEETFSFGINIVDIIKLRLHILLINTFDDPLSYVIGDLDVDGKYNVKDIIILTKLALNIYDEFPYGMPQFRYFTDMCMEDDHCINGLPLPINPTETYNFSIKVIKMGDLSILE